MRPSHSGPLLAVLLLLACGDTDRSIGGVWYVRRVPADPRRHFAARLDLLRETNGVRVAVATFIGPTFRFYDPDCAMYEWPPSAAPRYAYREVHLACGDHSPARVALLTRRGVRMDPDGLRPAAGVEMRPNSGIDSPPGDFEPRGFIAIADMRAAAERQPLSDRALAPALQHANHQVIWGIFAVAALGALLALVYRRRVIR